MTAMLGYSMRKRFRPMRRWGPLRYWLDLHILCGVLGPLFIVLHSSFKVQGLVALSFWSMIAVALSGVLGRYLYLQIPRAASGDRMTLAEVEAERERLGNELLEGGAIDQGTVDGLGEVLDSAMPVRKSLLSLLLMLPLDGWRLRRRLAVYSRSLESSDHPVSQHWVHAARRKLMLERRLRLLAQLQALFHYWHVIHKPFAIVMYVFMLVHIVVATVTGYVL